MRMTLGDSDVCLAGYKELKKLLKPLAEGSAEPGGKDGGQPEASLTQAAEQEFFERLQGQLRRVDSEFDARAKALIARYKRSQSRYGGLCLPFFLGKGQQAARGAKLSQDAYWCRKYAKANAVALRKILKKHDKVAGNSRGRDFLRDSWQSHGREGVGTFLHSPLLDELKAIQDVLSEEAVLDPELEAGGGLGLADGRGASETGSGCAAPPQDKLASSAPACVGGLAATDGAVDLLAESRHWRGSPRGAAGDGPRPGSAGRRSGRSSPAPSSAETVSDPGVHRAASETRSGRGAGLADVAGLRRIRTSAGPGSFRSTSSLRRQREEGLEAICESPSFLLDSSDEEWEEGALPGWARRASFRPGSSPIAEESVERGASPLGTPVRSALACGHKFCKRCALEAAGFGRAVGTFASIVSHVPRRAPCPACRQQDVYRGAVSLREVGRLIERRHPREWAERRGADKRLEREAAEAALQRQKDYYGPHLRATSVYELVF
ncbi:hypothetical protein QBZ16_003425 [Prototheca wickerhamii]|uniref:RING-type E3 ubiquitin transferase n=1 Tax=Prototheca wickerhamii TaxID=3111 RepID=A0AAD9MKS2_PROWI|nr:hypothetical protein QBZ16_003425 [Prototheca wickerhamii]